MIKNTEFVNKLLDIQKHNTIYGKGMVGQPINQNILNQKYTQYGSWYADKKSNYEKLIGKNYWGFDCLGLIKACCWGWNGNANHNLGGATYQSNGIPDTTEIGMINLCSDVSTNMSNIEVGELLYMRGHVGAYIGNNKVIECTTAGTGNVQITGITFQKWEKHGKLPCVDYAKSTNANECPYTEPTIELHSGISNVEGVKWLQWHLVKLGFLASKYDGIHDSVDGSWGNATSKAFLAFQQKYPSTGTNGKPDGSCGQASRAQLKALLSTSTTTTQTVIVKIKCPYTEPTDVLYQGCRNTEGVKWLQWHLVQSGFLAQKYDGVHDSVDGSWGYATTNAFKKFQDKYPTTGQKLPNGQWVADGRCGVGSRTQLKKLI